MTLGPAIVTADFRDVGVPADADLVLVDPPYGLGKDYDGTRETTTYSEWVEALCEASTAPWLMIFGPSVPTIDYARLKPDRVIIWTKTMAQIRKSLGWWQYGVTPILVYRTPGAPWYGGSALPGAWDYIAAPSALSEVARIRRYLGNSVHPGITGTFIARKLIAATTKPGDLVADPMCGTGSILAAAAQMERRVWGAEIIPAYADVARRWVEDVTVR